MNRETKKFKVPVSGVEVEIYNYLTGGEERELTSILVNSAKYSMGKDQKIELNTFDPKAVVETEKKTIEILVKSIDGKTEDIYKEAMNLPSADTDNIIDKLNEIRDENKKKAKGGTTNTTN